MQAHFRRAVHPWLPDNGDGTYSNPLIHADYSDPDVIRHGADFYMVSSSFTCTPGLPILHSRDLVNWKLINHAIRQVPHPSYENVRLGNGVWAPAIRFHAGKFWIFFPMPEEGIFVTCADDPAGEWSEPWCLQEAKGWIDPCPFWDDDGQAYLFHAYAFSRSGKKERIHCRPMSSDCRRLLGEGRELFHTPHHLYLEGPKVHKLDGWYYILAPGGGVPTGWQVVFRSRDIWGPYEEKIVLEQGSTPINGPHQGALVDLENGEWWFLHFQDAGPFGRIVHMQPVRWEGGWPLMGVDFDQNGVGEPVTHSRKPDVVQAAEPCAPQTTDEFENASLGLQWQWQANHRDEWYSLTERPGWLRLKSQPFPGDNLCLLPSLLMQKFPAREFAVETDLDFEKAELGDEAGIVVTGGGTHASLVLRRSESGFELVYQLNGQLVRLQHCEASRVRLSVTIDSDARCTFGIGAHTRFTPPFHAREGGWIGAKVGLYCRNAGGSSSGSAAFDYFRVLAS